MLRILAKLSTDQVQALSTTAIKGLSTAGIVALTTSQVEKLGTDQIASIPLAPAGLEPEEVDAHDAEHLYRLLETDIVPLWYDRDSRDVPQRWVRVMKEAMPSLPLPDRSMGSNKGYPNWHRAAKTTRPSTGKA